MTSQQVDYHVVVTPDIWTVLTAVGTVSAVAVALLATWWGISATRRERAQIDDREARAEARKVLAVADGRPGVEAWIEVRNAGEEPILEVLIISSVSNPRVEDRRYMYRWEPSDEDEGAAALVLPGAGYKFPGRWRANGVGADLQSDEAAVGEAAYRVAYTELAWTDSRDRHWIRQGRSQPIEIRNPFNRYLPVEVVRRADAGMPLVVGHNHQMRIAQQRREGRPADE